MTRRRVDIVGGEGVGPAASLEDGERRVDAAECDEVGIQARILAKRLAVASHPCRPWFLERVRMPLP